MKDVIAILEKLGIEIIETAEPKLIADGLASGLEFLSQRLAFREAQLKELKVVQHMATIGRGLLKDDVQILFVEACIDSLAAAIKVLFDYQSRLSK